MRTWSLDDIRALGVRTDLVTACEAALGVGKRKAYELVARGQVPFPLVKVGARYVVPTAGVLRFLDVEMEKGPAPPRQANPGPS